MTLRFLGEVDGSLAADLDAGLAEARARAPFTVTLDGLASFGGDRPRAVYASVVLTPELADLQEEHDRIARTEERRDRGFQLVVHGRLAEQQRCRGAPRAVRIDGALGLLAYLVMVRQAQIVECREVEDGLPR